MELPVKLAMEHVGTGEKRMLQINADKLKPGSYSTIITFYKQENMSEPKRLLRVVKHSGNVLKIRPINPKEVIRCGYRYSSAMGYEPKKLDSTFVYRLPFSQYRSEPVRVSYLKNAGQRFFNRMNSRNWAALQFHLEKGDTVFAIRKGEVIRIEDGNSPKEYEGKLSYTSNRNFIAIEHSDGMVCHYSILQTGSFMVSEGDIVYPGTPLGLCEKQNLKSDDYQVRLFINYPIPNPEYEIDNPKTPNFLYVYYNPVFVTDQGIGKLDPLKKYKAVSSKELIEKEMTKKELKKYNK